MFMPDADWAKLSANEKLQNILKFGGYAIANAFGMGEPGMDAVDHPKTTLALAALGPVAKGVKALIPSAERAGANFETVMQAAKNVPIDVREPGKVALRIHELASRGGSMPKSVRDILNRMTDPNKGELTYGEARDFYHNISRLSADEYKRLTPVIRREIGQLRVALNKSLEGAAQNVNRLPEYKAAMREYARSAQVRGIVDDTVQSFKKYALPGGLAYYAYGKLSGLVGGEK